MINQPIGDANINRVPINDTFDNDEAAYDNAVRNPSKWGVMMVSQHMADRMRRNNLLAEVPRINSSICQYLDTSVLNPQADPQMKYFIPFKGMDKGRIYATLSSDAVNISTSAGMVINASSSLVMLVFTFILLAYISVNALMMAAV